MARFFGAQLPAVVESLTGVELNKLIEQVPILKAAMTKRGDGAEKPASLPESRK